MTPAKPSIVFMGTPEFARVSLEALVKAGYPILAVVSQPSKPAGRGKTLLSPPCAAFAEENNLPLLQPAKIKTPEAIESIARLKPDFIVVAAYGKLLPQAILDIPKIDILNVHASLLPEYRGAAPIQRSILEGKKETGVSIMRVQLEMDAGPVYLKRSIPIERRETSRTLFSKLAALGSELLLEAIPQIATGSIKPQEQDFQKVTHAPPIKKEEGKIQWGKSAAEIERQIRAFTPWPSAHTFVDNKTLKIYDAEALPETTDKAPGTVYFLSEKGIHVACGNSSLCVTQVQLEGKKQMRASEFVRGYRLETGFKFS